MLILNSDRIEIKIYIISLVHKPIYLLIEPTNHIYNIVKFKKTIINSIISKLTKYYYLI